MPLCILFLLLSTVPPNQTSNSSCRRSSMNTVLLVGWQRCTHCTLNLVNTKDHLIFSLHRDCAHHTKLFDCNMPTTSAMPIMHWRLRFLYSSVTVHLHRTFQDSTISGFHHRLSYLNGYLFFRHAFLPLRGISLVPWAVPSIFCFTAAVVDECECIQDKYEKILPFYRLSSYWLHFIAG